MKFAKTSERNYGHESGYSSVPKPNPAQKGSPMDNDKKKGALGKWLWRGFCLFLAFVMFSAVKGGFAQLVEQQNQRNFLLAPGSPRGAEMTPLTPEISFWGGLGDVISAPFSLLGDFADWVSLPGILITLLIIVVIALVIWVRILMKRQQSTL